MSLIVNMKVHHEYARQDDGQIIPVTRCRYADETGHPLMASLHGHLHEQIAERMIRLFREADARQVKAK